MLKFIKSFFGFREAEPKAAEAPYKVEAPVVTPVMVPPEPVKCGCGRSDTGFCVGLHKLTAEEWAAHPKNPNPPVAEKKPAVKAKTARAKKAPVAAMTAAEKPKKAPAKPRAPRKPKAK